MILTDAELRRREEWDALRELQARENVNDLRNQLQAAVELLGERMGADPNQALAERVARNRAVRDAGR